MNTSTTVNDAMTTAATAADPTVPVSRVTRDFAATPAQLFRAHTDPKLFVRARPVVH